jgi:hypothetical protein
MKTKSVTVEMTFSWTFDEKDWSEEKEHVKIMKEDPRIVFGYDTVHSIFMLNDIVYPELKKVEVNSVD